VQTINDKNLYRIVDANFNRAKEGLRVCEDICRFVYDAKGQTRKWKDLRHQLTKVVLSFGLKRIVHSRNIQGDVGKATTRTELKRNQIADIFYANSQRVKESIRVLEEFAKLLNKTKARELKKIRYQVYALEKKIVEKY